METNQTDAEKLIEELKVKFRTLPASDFIVKPTPEKIDPEKEIKKWAEGLSPVEVPGEKAQTEAEIKESIKEWAGKTNPKI